MREDREAPNAESGVRVKTQTEVGIVFPYLAHETFVQESQGPFSQDG
jgi:hypothetical protein